MSISPKCSERQLTVAMVACLTGLAPDTVRRAFRVDPKLVDQVQVRGRMMSIPVSAYNAWTGCREPERLVSSAEARALTGFHKNTVIAHFKTSPRLRPFVVCLGGRLAVPVSAFNAWLDDARLYPTKTV